MEISEPTLDELQDELVENCKELISDIFMLECLLQYQKGTFLVSREYTEEDCEMTLYRLTDYINQHIQDVEVVGNGIRKRLCAIKLSKCEKQVVETEIS